MCIQDFRAIRSVASVTIYPRVDGEIARGGSNCYNDAIDAGESPLTVQTGDILGACVFNPEDMQLVANRFPLDVVGEASGESLLQMGTAGCSRDNISSVISANDHELITLNSRLHIYANIGKNLAVLFTISHPKLAYQVLGWINNPPSHTHTHLGTQVTHTHIFNALTIL